MDAFSVAQTGVVPDIDWSAYGLTIEDVGAVIQSMTYSISPDPDAEEPTSHASAAAHFGHVINGLNLRINER